MFLNSNSGRVDVNLYVLKDTITNIKAIKHIKNNNKIIILNSIFKEAKCPKLKISNSIKEITNPSNNGYLVVFFT